MQFEISITLVYVHLTDEEKGVRRKGFRSSLPGWQGSFGKLQGSWPAVGKTSREQKFEVSAET